MSKDKNEKTNKNRSFFGHFIIKLFKFLFRTGLIIPIVFSMFYLTLSYIYSLNIKQGKYAAYFYFGLAICFICVILIWKRKRKAFKNVSEKDDISISENDDKKFTFKKFKKKKYKNVKSNRFIINNSFEEQNKYINNNRQYYVNNQNYENYHDDFKSNYTNYQQMYNNNPNNNQSSYRNVNLSNQNVCEDNKNYGYAYRNQNDNKEMNNNIQPKIYRHSKYERIVCFEYPSFIEFYCEEQNKKLIYLRREDK